MKGDKAEYVIPLTRLFRMTETKRRVRVIKIVKNFVFKHTKNKNIIISQEVNEFLNKNSESFPRRINAVLVKKGEAIKVYLKGGKQLAEDEKKEEEARKKRESEKKRQEEEKKKEEEKTAKEKEQEEKKKRELEEKREREKAAAKAEMK